MLHITLFEPEIPPNTGNIIRLCANCGAALHLIKPFAFELTDKQLRRAGLDYHDLTNVFTYENFGEFIAKMAPSYNKIIPDKYKSTPEQLAKHALSAKNQTNARIFACSTHGTIFHCDAKYQDGDIFLMGPETRGLPKDLRESFPSNQIIKIPMLKTSRSLNLSNATAIIIYEAWRQVGF